MEEPSMLAQRPSSSHLQQTSHILQSTFHDLFSQNCVDKETIRNLTASRTGNKDYHEIYVERLLEVQTRWCKKVETSHILMEHLNKARNHARTLEKKEYDERVTEFESYDNLGLPPVLSKLEKFLDENLLKDHNLIIPNEILKDTRSMVVNSSESEKIRQYESSTYASRQLFETIQPEDCYAVQPAPILPAKSNLLNQKPKKTEVFKRISMADGSHGDKNIWRNCINPVQREVEKKYIVNLQNKADFLKNPRFLDVPKSYLNKAGGDSVDLDSDFGYFKPSPSPVIFTDYEVSASYQAKLELKNVTSSCRQVRILKPSTKYFSVSGGEFPTESCLVAPGMSCYYIVTFTPDTLGNYEDILTVKTQAPTPMLIQLKAIREPPLLSLSKHMHCGFTLVGDSKMVEFFIQNDGGNGRFCFALEGEEDSDIDWENTAFDEEAALQCYPFTIQPSSFRLNSGESLQLKIFFKPTSLSLFTAKVFLLCDNCSKTEYSIEGAGESPIVELTYIEGGILKPKLGEIYDKSAEKIIQFGISNPGIVCQRELHVTNSVAVSLKYEWEIWAPSVSDTYEENIEVGNSVFKIEPVSGFLSGNSLEKFNILFTPNNIGCFFDVACLMLKNIPVEQEDGSYILEDEIAMKLSLKGSTEEYNIEVLPATVIMCGKCYVGLPYYRAVKLHNGGNASTSFKWIHHDTDECMINVDPAEGIIGNESNVECLLTITGKKVCQAQCMIEYQVPFSTKQHVLYFDGTFKGPCVNFNESNLSFDLIRYGTSKTHCVTLSNDTFIDASWKIRIIDNGAAFSFYPSEGILTAGSSQKLAVHCHPLQCQSLNSLAECLVEGGEPSYLPVYAEVLRPNVYMERCEITVEEAFLDVPIERKITLVNTNLLTARFQWLLESEVNKGNLGVTCTPQEGRLKPHEKLNVYLQFTFHKLGIVEYFVVCQIDEMLDPLVLCVQAKVNGLNIDVTMPNMADIRNGKEVIRNNDILEFGENNLIGKPVDAFVIIENKSAIETKFTMSTQMFQPSKAFYPPKKESGKPAKSTSKHPLLWKTLSATNSMKTEEQEFKDQAKSILQDGKGVSFVCTPAVATLNPFETKIVTITAYSDMWGEYNDTLICKVGDLAERRIPMHIDIIGSPLNFQMFKNQVVMVRFGSHVSGGKAVSRSLRINNTSHVDIRLDWQTFLISEDDEKLIDLNVFYGAPFPIFDCDGNEIAGDINHSDKLIKVSINEHYGNETDTPFKIKDSQVVIAGKSHGTMQVGFQPPSEVFKETTYLGYALGYMSLYEKDQSEPGVYSRLDGIDMFPFSLNMTGYVEPAKLYLETVEDEGFEFHLNASDLIKDNSFKEKIRCERHFVMRNISSTTVTFTCNIDPPFKILSIGEMIKGKSVKNITLKPQGNCKIAVAFELTPNLAATIYENENREMKGILSAKFINKDTQKYEVIATVNYPVMSSSEKLIDFGTCFVGEQYEQNLTIYNLSKVLLHWNIKKEKKCPEACKSVFSISASDGMIDGDIAGTSGSFTDIKLYFIPKNNVGYECIFLLSSLLDQVCLKKEPIKLIVRGAGSYDEAAK